MLRDGTVHTVKTNKVLPDPDNLKEHSEENVQQIASSITRFGFLDPIGVVPHPDQDGFWLVVEGHGRLEAAQYLKLREVPVVVLDLTDAQRRAYGIAHNQVQQISGMNGQAVAREFERLGVTVDDYRALGFSEEDVLFLPQVTESSDEDGGGPASLGSDHSQWKEYVPVVHKTTLRFANEISYNRFVHMLAMIRDQRPLLASMAERLASVVEDLGYATPKTDPAV